MSPIEGVKLIEGDITREETVKEILKYFNGQKPELIICDGNK
jgi:23S rRNA U2552 (ribose-2'-O)-methylase RlmE/FtsJ